MKNRRLGWVTPWGNDLEESGEWVLFDLILECGHCQTAAITELHDENGAMLVREWKFIALAEAP